MKKVNFTALILVFVLLCTFFAGCNNDSKNKDGGKKDEQATMIIATAAPTEDVPTEEPTAVPEPTPERKTDEYVNLVEGNEHVFYSASSIESEHTSDEKKPSYCYDNNPDTRWSSVQNDVEESWIGVSFGYPVKLGALDVIENKTWGTVGSWDVQYFDEAAAKWITVYEGYGFDDEEHYITDKESPETYSIRILFYDCSTLAVTLNEIDFFGIKVPVEEGTEPRTYEVEKEEITKEKITTPAEYSASSTENEGNEAALVPAFTFDGNNDTRWSTVFDDLYADECWLCTDFSEEVTMSGFIVNEVTSWGHVTEYEFQMKEGDSWTTIYKGSTFEWDKMVELDKEYTGKTFRFLFIDGEASVGTVTIAEIGYYK